MSRGIRNNNPGNIRLSRTEYLGEVRPSGDKEFKQFISAAWGYRALFVLLHTYSLKHGLRTIEEMIGRYAPPSENDTVRYVSFVSYRAGIRPDKPLNTLCGTDMKPIAAAISRMENGIEADPDALEQGWQLFMKHRP